MISTKARQVVGLALFRGMALWEASLWAKAFRRSVAERARLPQGMAMQGREAGVRSRLVARLLHDVTVVVQAGNGLLDSAEWDRQKGGYFYRGSASVRG